MSPAPRSQIVGYAVLAVVVLLIGGRWLAARGSHPAGGGFAGSSAPAAAPRVQVQPARREAVVHVAGAVRRPGVYRLAAGKRVADAVKCAGGPTRHGDVNAINLAAPVQDGVQVIVPVRGAAAVSAASGAAAGGAATPGAPVDLNTATEAELETLDGVGPATASKILAYRREHGGFRTVEDLLQVSGIGPKKLAAIKPRVRT